MSELTISVVRPPRNAEERDMVEMAMGDIWRPYRKMIADITAYRIPTVIVENGMLRNEWDHATQRTIDTITKQAEEAVKYYLRQQHLL